MEMHGVVINLNYLGGVVRLVDGSLAAIPPAEVTAHQDLLRASLREHRELPFAIRKKGKHAAAFLSEQALPSPAGNQATETQASFKDPDFEERMTAYLRERATELPDQEASAQERERRKVRRAQLFEKQGKQPKENPL